ncbi:MAG: NADPH-dependent oxidoreductase [Bacteroidetes bacterium]|nr:MAG: NADPH-dependent oxidoreductase [Bacteroidota bacterium]
MIQTILNHRSIRKYKEKEIEKQVLDEVLLAGTKASTTGNMQVYSIIVTSDKAIKDQLWEVHFKQDMVKQAPVILTFCADFNRFNKWCELRDTSPGYDNFLSFYTASIDALLAAQNVAIAAESHGLGICYLGTTTYMADKIINILDIPENVIPVTTLVIGYPDENPDLTDRLPLEGVIHYEKYNDFNEQKINKIYEEKEELPSTKELIKINQTENLAQIFTEKRYTKKDNIHFSKSFFDVITKQGFMNHE